MYIIIQGRTIKPFILSILNQVPRLPLGIKVSVSLPTECPPTSVGSFFIPDPYKKKLPTTFTQSGALQIFL